jgi:hypothetical protein
MTPSTVTTVMKNADKIKRSHQLVWIKCGLNVYMISEDLRKSQRL